ncbi:MAG: hypothetical protein Q8R24_02155 [Legionellaceae bacterium]|nr:hypothetical protein [Legionellaceae bacterium]
MNNDDGYISLDRGNTKKKSSPSPEQFDQIYDPMINCYNNCVGYYNDGIDDSKDASDQYQGVINGLNVFNSYELQPDLKQYVEQIRRQFDEFSNDLLKQIDARMPSDSAKERASETSMLEPFPQKSPAANKPKLSDEDFRILVNQLTSNCGKYEYHLNLENVNEKKYTDIKSGFVTLYCYELDEAQRSQVNRLAMTFNRISERLFSKPENVSEPEYNEYSFDEEKKPVATLKQITDQQYAEALEGIRWCVAQIRSAHEQMMDPSHMISPRLIQNTLDDVKQSYQFYDTLLEHDLGEEKQQAVLSSMLKDDELDLLNEALNQSQRSLPHNSPQRKSPDRDTDFGYSRIGVTPLLSDDSSTSKEQFYDVSLEDDKNRSSNNDAATFGTDRTNSIFLDDQAASQTSLKNLPASTKPSRSPVVKMLLTTFTKSPANDLLVRNVNEGIIPSLVVQNQSNKDMFVPSFYMDYIGMATGVFCIAVGVTVLLLALLVLSGPAVVGAFGVAGVAAVAGVGLVAQAGRHMWFGQPKQQEKDRVCSVMTHEHF